MQKPLKSVQKPAFRAEIFQGNQNLFHFEDRFLRWIGKDTTLTWDKPRINRCAQTVFGCVFLGGPPKMASVFLLVSGPPNKDAPILIGTRMKPYELTVGQTIHQLVRIARIHGALRNTYEAGGRKQGNCGRLKRKHLRKHLRRGSTDPVAHGAALTWTKQRPVGVFAMNGNPKKSSTNWCPPNPQRNKGNRRKPPLLKKKSRKEQFREMVSTRLATQKNPKNVNGTPKKPLGRQLGLALRPPGSPSSAPPRAAAASRRSARGAFPCAPGGAETRGAGFGPVWGWKPDLRKGRGGG